MNKNTTNLQFYKNNNKCVSLPQDPECDYLRISNYLSEYQTEQEKQQVLENLGIIQKLEQLQNSINNKLDLFATLQFLDDNYVKKIDLYYPEEDDDDGFEEIPTEIIGGTGTGTGSGWTVDDFLSLTSINPVQNRIITAALNTKADISLLNNYISLENLSGYLSGYQHVLTAGYGIKIQGNVISATLDLNPFVFVDTLPTTGDPNKIYLVPDRNNPGVYIQYHYDPNQRKWIEIGRVSIQSTFPSLDNYLTLDQADARYAKKGETTTQVVQVVLNQVQQLLSKYVKKSEVYTPDLWGDDSTSGDITDNPGGSGGGIVLPDSGIDWSNYVNITVDNTLNASSFNPVTNRAITNALALKQDKLTSQNAGNGISISSDGVISCTLDTSIYRFVTILPVTGIDTNKIYLLSSGDSTYKQYVYDNGWKLVGNLDLGVDLTGYLSKSEASQLYMTKLDLSNTYLSKVEFSEYMNSLNLGVNPNTTNPTNVDLSAYATKQWVTELILGNSGSSSINLSAYATKEWVTGLISNINNGLDEETLNKLGELETYLSRLSELESQVNNTSNYLDIMNAIAAKADTDSVYNKNYIDQNFQKKGDFITRTDFTSQITTLTNQINAFRIDETLSSTSTNAVQNKTIYRELQKYLTNSSAQETYATKNELESGLSSVSINLKTVNGQSLLGTGNVQITFPVDTTVTENGSNPVSGRAVYQYVGNYVTGLSLQGLLTAGNGINIDSNNVISVTLDSINPFIITDTKPAQGQPNKMYLIKEQGGYRQWIYENNTWVDKGLLDLSVDLSNYVTTTGLGTELNSQLTALRTWVTDTFLKKEDVYTPDQLDSTSSGISENTSSSSSSGSILPPSSSGTSSGGGFYNTDLANGIKTNVAVGNIAANTDVSTLKGLSFTELFNRILFKETYNNPNYQHYVSIDTTQTLVKVGTVMETPTVVTNWNTFILPQQSITSSVSVRKNNETATVFQPGSIYDAPGTYTFILNYSYPAGSYEITSNYGNTRTQNVPAFTGSKSKSVRVTYPWYVDNIEQSPLVPISEGLTKEMYLSGAPTISIPGANSVCTIKVDLGLGYMDVTWNRTTEIRNGITYSVWSKPDNYQEEVKHKITFNIYL